MNYLNLQTSGTRVIGSIATSIFWFDSGGLSSQKAVSLGQFGDASLMNIVIQASGNGGLWGTIDGTSFGSLGSAGMISSWYNTPARFIRAWGWSNGSRATCVYEASLGEIYRYASPAAKTTFNE